MQLEWGFDNRCVIAYRRNTHRLTLVGVPGNACLISFKLHLSQVGIIIIIIIMQRLPRRVSIIRMTNRRRCHIISVCGLFPVDFTTVR